MLDFEFKILRFSEDEAALQLTSDGSSFLKELRKSQKSENFVKCIIVEFELFLQNWNQGVHLSQGNSLLALNQALERKNHAILQN